MSKILIANWKMDELKEWWNNQQQKFQMNGYKRYLSNYSGPEIWNFLKINVKGKVILNIGVGTGRCTKDLADKKAVVYALDISEIALKRVSQYTIENYLPNQLEKLPQDFFDLSISHLVAQHMSDEDLLEQMRGVIKSLKPKGIFAMQFASNDKNNRQDIESQMKGGVCRNLENMEKLVEKAGGEMILVNERFFPKLNVKWHAIHIRKCQK